MMVAQYECGDLMARCDRLTQARALPTAQVLLSMISAALVTMASPGLHDAHALPSQESGGFRSILTSSFVYPLMGPRESSDYGVRRHPIRKNAQHHHDGIDLAAPRGAIIRAIASGRVMYSDPFGGYGNLVVIKHESGLTSHYGHCETIKVRVGQAVRAGDIIATVGSTGRSTGPHLHFEIRRNGKPQHPENLLPGLADPTRG